MGKQTIEYCSLQYMNLWIKNDALCVKALSEPDENEKLLALKKAAKFYSVARNLPLKYEEEKKLKRYEPVMRILDKVSTREIQKNTVEYIHQIEREISEAYGNRGVLSLTTKFLWLKEKSPVIIYDSQVKKALKVKKVDTLEAFYNEWHNEFEKQKNNIKEACSNLASLHKYVHTENNQIYKGEIEKLTAQTWFHWRVFDTYLWNKGNS